jgi:5'-nucleotidase
MRILITNDDSISATQLLPFIKFWRKQGEVTVCVPKYEQSAKSHAIELVSSFSVEKILLDGDIETYAVGSTPADCVRYAVLGLKREFDLVVSGVNRGFNIGTDILYSGTVAAIEEAAILGIPAIAFSTSPENYDNACVNLEEIYEYIKERRLLDIHSLYNINIPASPKGIKITRQGGTYYSDGFVPTGENMVIAEGICVYKKTDDLTLDTNAVMSGYISIMPATINVTDKEIFEKLK